MNYELLKVTKDGAVATVELNRAPVNALNGKLLRELHAVSAELNADGTTKVALLIGAGKHFAAGADIKEIASIEGAEAVSEFSSLGTEAFLHIERGHVIFIALVRGFCLGGGCELAMACNMRIADRSAIFGQPEVKLGICPGFGATQRLPLLVGRSRALYLLTTGESIDAARAAEWGLADLIVPEGGDLLTFGKEVAAKIAAFGRPVLNAITELVCYTPDVAMEQGLERESEVFGELSQTEDMKEGFAAFIEKRPAVFKDR